jgi:hypothetical protein
MSNTPHEIGTDLVGLGKIGTQLIQTGEHFIDKLFGPYLEARGELIAAKYKRKNLAIVGGLAAEQLREREVKQAIPGRILFPLASAASNEDDPKLQQMWAALLAHAADATQTDEPLPAFISILRDLSSVEAVILRALYKQEDGKTKRVEYESGGARFNPSTVTIIEDDGTATTIRLPFGNFRVVADNLMRLGLVEQYFTGASYGTETSARIYSELTLTPLGHHFVQVCTAATSI